MTSKSDGSMAEAHTAKYLEKRGFKIIETNWKTPKCEIDIVAKKDNCVYFVEVKYRSKTDQGEGFEYITTSKMRQMAFAAEMWVTKNKWDGEYCLSGSSVFGENFDIEFIDEL